MPTNGLADVSQTEALPLAALLLAEAEIAIEQDPARARTCIRQISALLDAYNAQDSETETDVPAQDGQFTRGGLASWQFRLATAFIEKNLADTILVRDLASLARLSISHFCRAFKATTGETPHRYIVRRRLERAQTIMLTTEENLSQIASACGLTDHAHLTRLFRQHVGATPYAWRQTWRQAA